MKINTIGRSPSPCHSPKPVHRGRIRLLLAVLVTGVLAAAFLVSPPPACAGTAPVAHPPAAAGAGAPTFTERVVAGGPEHFMEVRHVVIRGSNYYIGEKIAQIAGRFQVRPVPSDDQSRNASQRNYLKNAYPILYERMRGLAAAFELSVDDDRYDFSALFQFPMAPPGCSAVFYPGTVTESGHGVLSRNYDFTTGTIDGRHPGENEVPAMSRPIIFELHPDEGYASIAVCAFELVGGVLDGINSEGLTVAIFGDDETIVKYGRNPSMGIGVHELASMRYLLDNCGTVEQAKKALLTLKQFYAFIPCHYLVADTGGNSFIFEFSPQRDRTFIIDGEGPQCITNHLVSSYASIDELPEEAQIDSYDRYRKLYTAIRADKKFTLDDITRINEAVAASGIAYDNPDRAAGRTLWHALYDVDRRSLSVKFYLGEKADPSDTDGKVAVYSDYVELILE